MQAGDVVITPHGPAAVIAINNSGRFQDVHLYFFRQLNSTPDEENNINWAIENVRETNAQHGWWVYTNAYPVRPLKNPLSLRKEERLKIMRWKLGENWGEAFAD